MDVTELLSSAIANINDEVVFHAVQENADGNYEFYSTNTKWLSLNKKVEFSSVEYTVVSLVQNVYVELSGDSIPSVGSYSIGKPTFIHGKLKEVNSELASKKNEYEILPLIWNFELQPRTLPSNRDTVFQSEGAVRLFVLNSTNIKQFTTQRDYSNNILPLESVIKELLIALRKEKRAGVFNLSRQIVHSKFTTGGQLNGSKENWVLGKTLSGIEIEIELPVLKRLSCPVRQFPVGGSFSSGFSSGFDIN